MGRKPNTLVLEFFDRGDKLDDNSNRYQQTCKRCGEFFAKGRIDSLLSHIQRKCPHVTPWDRDKVAFHQQNNTQSAKSAQANNSMQDSNNNMMSFDGFQPTQQELVQYELPLPAFFSQRDSQPQFYPQQGQSALETLAEVSRQHLDYSAHRPQYNANDYPQDQALLGADHGAEQALLSELHHHGHTGEQSQQQAFANAVLASSALTSSPLIQTASAANHHLEQSQVDDQQHQHPIDPNLGAQEEHTHYSPAVQPPSQAQGSNVFTWQQTNTGSKPTQSFGSLTVSMPSNEPDLGLSLVQDGSKGKGRSRFNTDRRKEVQSIRKQGACIRCRMLKKPCSEGTPCQTCSNVDSARLWKGKCMRTKLADEFTLYSTSLFHAKSHIETLASVESRHNDILPGQIVAELFPVVDLSMAFHIRRYTTQEQTDGSDDILLIQDSELHEGGTGHEKVERYFRNATSACIEAEQSPFFKATLQEAINLSHEAKLAKTNSKDKTATRASYNLQDKLLDNIISLCAATSFLTRPSPPATPPLLNLSYQPPTISHPNPATGALEPQPTPRIPLHFSNPSHALIHSQLLSATEAFASKICKLVLNELERRLLQRQQASTFATIIASVLLLGCVERMCGLYSRFGRSLADEEVKAAWWPLDSSPEVLLRRVARFGDLLVMLLRMRALPPRTVVDVEGVLRVRREGEGGFGRRAGRGEESREGERFVGWLEPLDLSGGWLSARRDGVDEEGEGAGGWDMRFVADVLLPPRPVM